MPVSRAIGKSLLLLVALAAVPRASRAEGIAFVHDATIYQDAKEGQLKAPQGVACTENGNVVVADTGNQRLLMYAFKDGRLGGGTELKLTQLTRPLRVQITSKGDVLVLDGKTRKIVKVGANGTFAGTIDPKGIDDAANVIPAAFKVDASDNVYLLDAPGRRVLVMDATGAVTNQVAIPAEAGTVMDVDIDLAGTLYVVDAVSASLWSAEKGAKTFKPLTKSMKDRMSFPTYLTASRGRLFLVDQNGNGIVMVGVDGSYQGRQLSIGWSEGLVNYPAQLCLAPELGYAFLADRYNNRVQVFSTGK
jgi:hypothetical protein